MTSSYSIRRRREHRLRAKDVNVIDPGRDVGGDTVDSTGRTATSDRAAVTSAKPQSSGCPGTDRLASSLTCHIPALPDSSLTGAALSPAYSVKGKHSRETSSFNSASCVQRLAEPEHGGTFPVSVTGSALPPSRSAQTYLTGTIDAVDLTITVNDASPVRHPVHISIGSEQFWCVRSEQRFHGMCGGAAASMVRLRAHTAAIQTIVAYWSVPRTGICRDQGDWSGDCKRSAGRFERDLYPTRTSAAG